MLHTGLYISTHTSGTAYIWSMWEEGYKTAQATRVWDVTWLVGSPTEPRASVTDGLLMPLAHLLLSSVTLAAPGWMFSLWSDSAHHKSCRTGSFVPATVRHFATLQLHTRLLYFIVTGSQWKARSRMYISLFRV